MVKQGGYSDNSNSSKKGIRDKSCSCSICGRRYKQGWTKDRHEKQCKEFNNAHKMGLKSE